MNDEQLLEELYSSNFTVFLGNFGTGKSISQTYLSIMSAMLNKRKVVMSNTPIFDLSSYGLEFIPLISTSQFTENMQDIEIVLDELQKIANSRKSLSPENSFVTEFSTDVRKFNQGIVATAQYNNTFDTRLNDNTEINIVPHWVLSQKKDRKNFMVEWNLVFLDTMETENITLNMRPMLDLYNTNFKPLKLVVNHNDYWENMEDRHTSEYCDKQRLKVNKALKNARNVFDEEMRGRY